MMGVGWEERKGLEPLGWLGFDSMDFAAWFCAL